MPSKNRAKTFDNKEVGKKVERSVEELRAAALTALNHVANGTESLNVEDCAKRIKALNKVKKPRGRPKKK